MNFLKPIITCVAVSALALNADAIIAKRGLHNVTQPDGTVLQVRLVGDEHMHFVTTDDGRLLHQDSKGLYTFATLAEDGSLESTGISATTNGPVAKSMNIKDVDMSALIEKRGLATRIAQTHESLDKSSAADGRRRAPQTGQGLCFSTFPSTGSPKGLIILVEYKDVSFTTANPEQYFNNMINQPGFSQNGATGSALDYFTEQSNGVFTPDFDVLGPVKLDYNRSYYGGNDSYGQDARPHVMVSESIRKLDATVDFSVYDTDKDGLLDNVFIIYAGAGEASGGPSESVWPHSWDIRYGGISLKVDGVQVGHYACSNEMEGSRPDGIGTFVHEFSHVMGLPDLYRTDGNSGTFTPGEYSVLDYGPYNNAGRTPPNYGAYERNAMGWGEPIMLDCPVTVSLDPISSGQFGLIPTSKNNEFFLLENRQLTGWDAYIPNHGMLIWHIDYNESVFSQNIVNNTRSHQYVDIEEANNSANNANLTIMKGYPFPGTTGKTSFTSSTVPALKTWAGVGIDLPVTDITEEDGCITFNVAGGGTLLDVPDPTVSTPNSADRFFVASWAPVEGATDYYLTVVAEASGESGTVTNNFNDNEIPQGWEASVTNSFYATSTNYGESAPSYKFSTDGQSLTSPEVAGAIAKIEFWAKGMTTDGTTLDFQQQVNGSWETFYTYTPTSNKSANVALESEIPAGLRQFRMVMNKNRGNVAIDDIVITYGGKEEILADYNNVLTGGATEVRVDKLKEGHPNYYFTVAATDGKQRSKVSQPVHVTVSAMSGVENITVSDAVDADAPVEYFNVQGVRVAQPAAGTIVIERRGSAVRKVVVK